MRRALALWGALATAACASPERYIYAEPELVADSLTAIHTWNAALRVGPCPEVVLHLDASRDSADTVITVGRTEGFLARSYDGSLIRIDLSVAEPDEIPTVIAHELGHALGADDSSHEDDLMYSPKQPKRGPEPTGYDVARVCMNWR